MKKVVKLGMIGLGPRGETLLATLFDFSQDEVLVTAICDVNQERVERILRIIDEHNYPRPLVFSDYRELIVNDDVDAVLIPTSWNSHLKIAEEAMRNGKYAGIEVGGASSLNELWNLVRAAESTGVSCMMLENCCYGRNELLALNLARKGLFGEIIHCGCGYEHDISCMVRPDKDHGVRELHNRRRNGDLYPTHGIGPVAKILRINRGNRFMTLTSTASKSRGFALEAERSGSGRVVYNEGDVVTTVIRCANGETVMINHCISLPRPYSRDFKVQGTKGILMEDTKAVHIEGISTTRQEIDVAGNPYTVHDWTPLEEVYEKYDHPIWKKFRENIVGGHGGMDTLILSAFCDCVRNRTATPIDVYDCAAWMAITCLSEESIAMGGMPVAFPDFTDGKWIEEGDCCPGKWSLDEIYED